MSIMRAGRTAVTMLLMVLVLVVGARSTRADDLEGARKQYKIGVQHFNLGEYEDALVGFKEAYRIHGDPSFLYNIGQCQRLLGHKRDALQSFRAFLANAPRVQNRPELERVIDQLRADVTAEDDEKKRKQDAADAAAAAAAAQQAAAAAQAAQAAPVAAVTATPPPQPTPIYKKWWLWTAVGAVVVVGLGVGLGIGLTRSAYPNAHTTDGTVHF